MPHRPYDPHHPCESCRGTGWLMYSNTSGWRRGVGGAAMTWDQCEHCWGSGDADRPWPNLRELSQARKEADEDEVLTWFRAWSGLRSMRASDEAIWAEIMRVLEKQTRRRKLPDGVDPFWFHRTVERLFEMIKRLSASATRFGKRNNRDDSNGNTPSPGTGDGGP